MTSFIIQGTSKPTPKPEKNTRSSLSLSTLHIFSTQLRPPHTAPASRFTPYIQLRNEEEKKGRSKVEGSRSEYSPARLFAQTLNWGLKVDVVVFCFLDLASNYEPPDSLAEWLEAGEQPVCIGFDSLAKKTSPDKISLAQIYPGEYSSD
ncbi:unnamed protein product [Prunus armeniaca]